MKIHGGSFILFLLIGHFDGSSEPDVECEFGDLQKKYAA